jgi:hypothetical protein
MDFTQLYNQLVEDFNLNDLPEEEKEEMLLEVSKTIQKQFLLDVYDLLGEEQFEALQASANMGDEFYGNLDFCKYFPTFQKYISNIVGDIIELYDPDYGIDDISDFIYEGVGYETFVKLLMDEHGAKIRSFYNRKTRDC